MLTSPAVQPCRTSGHAWHACAVHNRQCQRGMTTALLCRLMLAKYVELPTTAAAVLETILPTCSCPVSASYSSMYAGRTPARVASLFSARSSSERRLSRRAESWDSAHVHKTPQKIGRKVWAWAAQRHCR
eukprot:GHRQ01028732.1.p3 GENE.GHRQ01028732.1~~GHRQ01028732.1.p3  ORF type:complete len:130 (-),score=12.83 GHRQ01028732.1:97-486(-)